MSRFIGVMYRIKHKLPLKARLQIPSKLTRISPKSVSEPFLLNTLKRGTTQYEQNIDWLSIYSQTELRANIFYKGQRSNARCIGA